MFVDIAECLDLALTPNSIHARSNHINFKSFIVIIGCLTVSIICLTIDRQFRWVCQLNVHWIAYLITNRINQKHLTCEYRFLYIAIAFLISHSLPRSNRKVGKRSVSEHSGHTMKAVFRPEISRFFSCRFRSTFSPFRQDTVTFLHLSFRFLQYPFSGIICLGSDAGALCISQQR
jgi:hypothetical protein